MKKYTTRILLATAFLSFSCLAIGQNDSTAVPYGNNPSAGHYVKVKGATLYYEVYGQGTPMLMIHGGLSSLADFSKNIPVLAKHFKVIAVDSRGYAKSSNELDSLSYELLTDDMVQLLDQQHIDSTYVVGFSDGGVVGLYMTAKYPSRVIKAFVSGANYLVEGLTDTNFEQNDMAPERVKVDSMWIPMRAEYAKLNPNPEKFDTQIQLIRNMWLRNPYIPKDLLTTIHKPVFLLYGDRDAIKLEHGVEIYHLLPQETTQLCILPNTYHSTFIENPKMVNMLLMYYFKEQ